MYFFVYFMYFVSCTLSIVHLCAIDTRLINATCLYCILGNFRQLLLFRPTITLIAIRCLCLTLIALYFRLIVNSLLFLVLLLLQHGVNLHITLNALYCGQFWAIVIV